jgi:hypothetical protein
VSCYIKNKEGVVDDEEWNAYTPVNLRCFEGVEWSLLREKGLVERNNERATEPLYVCPE